MEIRPGDVLGHYRLIERLAGGGMARLFRAVDDRDGRDVVVKLLPAAADAATRARFEREIRLLAELAHPRIVPLLDSGTVAAAPDGADSAAVDAGIEQPYLVLPLLRRGDLGDRIAREDGPLPLPLVRRYALQLCDALAYAHRNGVLHRDLKPANVLLDAAGDVQLADFGIALAAGSERLTQAGQAVGTPEFLAPEQALGVADMRSDVYSLGVILFQLATGRLPFAARGAAEWLRAHRDDPPPSLRALNPELPEPFERVVLRALAKAPEDRFQSALEMAAALRQALPEDATPTLLNAPVAVVEEVPTRRSLSSAADRGPSKILPILALVMLGAALATIAWLLWNVARRAPAAPTAPAPVTASTPVPAAAATVPPVAPTPVVPSHYDDFADAAYDGVYDRQRWTTTTDDTRLVQRQAEGVLRIRSALREQGLAASVATASPARVAVRVRLSAPVVASEATIGVSLIREDRPAEWVACYLYATRGSLRATPTCTDQCRRDFPIGRAVATGEWVVLALSPDRKELVGFDAGGETIGSLPLAQGDDVVTWYVMISAWSGDGKPVAGEVDWVDISP